MAATEFCCAQKHPMVEESSANSNNNNDNDSANTTSTTKKCCSLCRLPNQQQEEQQQPQEGDENPRFMTCSTCHFDVCTNCCQLAAQNPKADAGDAVVLEDAHGLCSKAREVLQTLESLSSSNSSSSDEQSTNSAMLQHAMELFQQALVARQAVVGSRHAAVAETRLEMARALAHQRHYPAALDQYQAALQIMCGGVNNGTTTTTTTTTTTPGIILKEMTHVVDLAVEAANYYMMQGMNYQAQHLTRDALWQFDYSHTLLASILNHHDILVKSRSSTTSATLEEEETHPILKQTPTLAELVLLHPEDLLPISLAFSDVCRVLASVHVSLVNYAAALPVLEQAHTVLLQELGQDDPRVVAMGQDRDTVQTLVHRQSTDAHAASKIPQWFERDDYHTTSGKEDESVKASETTTTTTTTDTATDPTNKNDSTTLANNLKGISIDWMKRGFWNQIQAAGLDANATVKQVLEKLNNNNNNNSVYVDSIPSDSTGKASVMAVCANETSIADLNNTLDDYCRENQLHDKDCFIWMQALCHGVAVENKKNGDTTDDADATTKHAEQLQQQHMAEIGHVLVILTPWYMPLVWQQPSCLMDIYRAKQLVQGCQLTLVLPPAQMVAVSDALVGDPTVPVDNLYQALERIPAAAASDDDNNNNDNTVSLDNHVYQQLQEMFRPWVRNVLKAQVREHCKSSSTIASESSSPAAAAAAAAAAATSQAQTTTTTTTTKGAAANSGGEAAMDVFKLQLCNKMGLLFWHYGEYKAALELLEDALTMTEAMYGNEHDSTATVYQNIANVLSDMGRYPLALETYLKVLGMMEATLPEHHPKIAGICTKLGNLCRITNDLNKAMEYHQRALTIQVKLHGSQNNLASADSYNDMGNVFFRKGDYDAALMEFRKALSIQESILDKTHPSLGTTHNYIGMVLKTKGNFDGALQEYRAALAIQEETLGNEHAQVAMTYENLAAVMRCQEDLDGALEMFEKAKNTYEKAVGLYNPSTASALQELGTIQNDMDQVEDALSTFRTALEIRESVLGIDHPSVGETLQSIGTILFEIGDLDEALETLRKAYYVLEPHLGVEHPTLKELADTINAVLEA